MLKESLPMCLCGGHEYISGSMSFGPSGGSENWKCIRCGRAYLYLSREGGNVLLTTKEPLGNPGNGREEGDWALPENLNEYANNVLLVAWRDQAAKNKEAEEKAYKPFWDAACDAAGVPHGTLFNDLPFDVRYLYRGSYDDAVPQGGNEEDFKKWRWEVHEKLSSLPEEEQERFRPYWDAACDRTDLPRGTYFEEIPETAQQKWRKATEAWDWNPHLVPGNPICPPQLPENMVAFVQFNREHQQAAWVDEHIQKTYKDDTPLGMNGLGVYALDGTFWIEVDPEYSRTLEVPKDPHLLWNTRFFRSVFREVQKNTSVKLPRKHQTKNLYGGTEPWYRWTLNGCTFVAGWRKRVVSISVSFPTPVECEHFDDLIRKDNVTGGTACGKKYVKIEDLQGMTPELAKTMREWYPDGQVLVDVDSNETDPPTCTTACAHAWGKDKCIEYLTMLTEMAMKCGKERAA